MRKNHLLEGSILKSIIIISIPIIFANVLQTVYQLIDTFWVGRLGAEAVAAVSLSFPILFFLVSLAMGLTMAGSILIAQYNGKGDSEKVSLSLGQTFSLVLIIAVILGMVGYFSSYYLLSLLTKDALVLGPATAYLKILFAAIPGMFAYMIFQASMNSIGKVKLPMYVVLFTVILNFFLDPLLMFGWKFLPGMGVAGVALATLITQYLSAIIGLIVLASGKLGAKLRIKYILPRFSWVKKIFLLGMPSSFEMSSRSFGMVLMTFVVSALGTLVVAAFGIGTRILSFIIIPAIGFSIATTSLVGNNLGARQLSRAEKIAKAGMKIAFWTLFVSGIILFVFASQISSFLVPNEPELVAMASNFIRIMSLTFGFIGIQMVITGTLKASGKTTTSMFLAMFFSFSLVIIGFFLSRIFGALGIWAAYPSANTLSLALALYFYKKKDWLRKKLV
ncbi:MATE family efflux transporter [Candidatus Woesearchaeota archaeon]|nr:MAG: MATE family efflux transporter [Candidatus Woesearchaeota archaeon]